MGLAGRARTGYAVTVQTVLPTNAIATSPGALYLHQQVVIAGPVVTDRQSNHKMAQTDVIALDDKKLRDLEQGGMPPAVPSNTGGIGNPAPLGLLCFGMTTGAPHTADDPLSHTA